MRKTQLGVYTFQCKVYVHCIHCVYGHCGVDNKDKSFIHFARCVDSKDKLYTLCLWVLFKFHICLNMISYQVAAGQITWARKGHNLFFNL